MLPDILNYVPDPNNGRPLAGAKVYFLIGGYDAPDQDSDLDVSKIAPITADGSEVPQPLYTSQGGTIRVGSQVNQPALIPSGLTQRVAVYDKCGKLVYQVEYSAEGPWVSSAALAASDSSVLIGGITAEALVALAEAGGGGGSGGGVIYDIPPNSLLVGDTYFNPETFELAFSYEDVDSSQYVTFPLIGTSTGGGGGGGVTYSFANASGTGNTILKTISSTEFEIKRIKPGLNVSITDDGNALTINSSGGGGGGSTTLSNAGSTGLSLVGTLVGSDYPIRRLQAGTNVTITDNGTYYTINSTGGGGGGSIDSLENISTGTGVGVYKDTISGVGRFRKLQSSDGSLSLLTDFDDIDMTVVSVPYTAVDDIPASRLLGRSAVGAGAAEAITLGTNLSLSGGVLNASSGVADGDKGDIVVTGSGATWSFDSGVVTSFARTFLDDTTAAGVRSTIGAQQSDATLTALAALSTLANQMIYSTGADTFAMTGLTTLARDLIATSTTSGMLNQLGILITTNANGTSVRIPLLSGTSGIQFAFKTNLVLPAVNITLGSGFTSDSLIWTYPQAFSGPAYVNFSDFVDNNVMISGAGSGTTSGACRGKSFTSIASTTVVCGFAIGFY